MIVTTPSSSPEQKHKDYNYDFEDGLRKWLWAIPRYQLEYYARQEAMEKMIVCYYNQSTELDLSFNNPESHPDYRLSSLPEQIGDLTSLEILNLSGNQLKTLPDSIANLENLQDLDLKGNPFTSHPEVLLKLHPECTVHVTGNPCSDPMPIIRKTSNSCPNYSFSFPVPKMPQTADSPNPSPECTVPVSPCSNAIPRKKARSCPHSFKIDGL
jgi:Leucine-rich repeat (LRR) protein